MPFALELACPAAERTGSQSQYFLDQVCYFRGVTCNMYIGGLERRDFVGGRSRSAFDDCARMSHSFSRRSCASGHKRYDRLFHMRFDERRRFLFVVAAYLADEDNGARLGIVF